MCTGSKVTHDPTPSEQARMCPLCSQSLCVRCCSTTRFRPTPPTSACVSPLHAPDSPAKRFRGLASEARRERRLRAQRSCVSLKKYFNTQSRLALSQLALSRLVLHRLPWARDFRFYFSLAHVQINVHVLDLGSSVAGGFRLHITHVEGSPGYITTNK